jgi:small conductance mechanosensitive channel
MIAAALEGYPLWVNSALAIGCVFVISYLIAEVASRFVWNIFRPMLGERAAGFAGASLLRPVRLIRVAIFLLVAGVLILPAMELAGVHTFVGMKPGALAAWVFGSGLRIGLILLLSYIIIRVVALVVTRFEQDVSAAGGADFVEHAKRIRTLGDLFRSTLGGLVSCIATLMILKELNLDITPILTGAGIVGLAVGFGAQTLVKDVISGFFLLLENQVRVGDVAAINGTGGLVEAITLRTIVLRDETGTVYIFPNGSITTLANMSKDFSFYVINLAVSYDEDPDQVMGVLRALGAELQADPKFQHDILAPIEILGVDNFLESHVLVKARIKTLPLKQWSVGRELRRRIKLRFDQEGIAFPSQRVKLHVTHGDPPPPEILAATIKPQPTATEAAPPPPAPASD